MITWRRHIGPSRSSSLTPTTTTIAPILSLPLLTVALALFTLTVVVARDAHRTRDFRALSDRQVRDLAALNPPLWDAVDSGHLGKLMIPRPSGSENNTLVQQYISSVFHNLGWHEEKISFTSETPIGSVDFTNLVYTFDPSAPRKIVLSAHFDSKWFDGFPANQFIGATDSAAPCAMMLDVAEALTPLLQSRSDRLAAGEALLSIEVDEEEAAETTLQLVFFDGEEAFHDWTASDSVYGARHLSSLWQDTFLPPHHPLQERRFGATPNVLNTIDVLVLLDLLGALRPRIHSYYRETDWLFTEMASADARLRTAGLVDDAGDQAWFQERRMHYGIIDDDHRPFLEKGVSVLHVISNPFPHVWHTLGDDATALDLRVLRRWTRILRVFTAGYLGLAPDDPPPRSKRSFDDELVRDL